MTGAVRPPVAVSAPDGSDPTPHGWLGRYALPQLWDAAGYDASHHDYAWQHRELSRLMSNECPLPPDEVVVEAAVTALREANLYPHSSRELAEALAEFTGVQPGSVILGNGSTEIIDVVTRTFISPGDEAVIPVPTYAFFETQVKLNGGIPVLISPGPGLSFDVDGIVDAVTDRTKLIFLCSPNNPIGRSWTVDEVERVLALGIPTLIDQAYLECGYGTSFASLIPRWPNLITTRTMSKAFGLAMTRVGYGLADPALIDLLLRVRIPFSVSLISSRACLAALRTPGYLETRRRFISEERDRVFAALERLPGVVPWPSETNFITIDVTETGRESRAYVDEAKAERLLLRRVAAHRLPGQYVRVTIGTHEENSRFLDVFSRSVAVATG